ncbi:sensor histidine kinase [Pseudomonas putida]
MRLSKFIFLNIEDILQAWEDFARTVEIPRQALDASGLRNHASFILKAVAHDLETPQTKQQEIDKSQGLGPILEGESAAQTHAVLRLMDGFTLDQVVSEYRALRSSVLRLWLTQEGMTNKQDQVVDTIRFNEAIDQALVESIASYGKAVETTRKMVLGVLGHDLRSPMGAVTIGAGLLCEAQEWGKRENAIAKQILASVMRANQLVDDLLDLARCNLSTGIPVTRQAIDLSELCESVVKELRLSNPAAKIDLETRGRVQGNFDPLRMAQVFTNLVMNALRHGESHQPVSVRLFAAGSNVVIEVHNFGEPIPADQKRFLFDPEARFSRFSEGRHSNTTGLGLGLYIAYEIVTGHGGDIQVESTLEHGTLFRVTIPSR